jgi:hypothetical protein
VCVCVCVCVCVRACARACVRAHAYTCNSLYFDGKLFSYNIAELFSYDYAQKLLNVFFYVYASIWKVVLSL